jgi:hypothetical protein
MRRTMTWMAFAMATMAFIPEVPAQSQRYFDSVVQRPPEKTRLTRHGRSIGEVSRWQVREALSPYNGLTLVWAVLDQDEVLLSVDGQSRFEEFASTGVPADAVAVVSGGMWTGRYDTKPNERRPAGLVASGGTINAPFVPLPNGGVLVACGDDVEITTVRSFADRSVPRPNAIRLPCPRASMLQANLILVRDGVVDRVAQDTPANRIAIGAGNEKIVIAGAFIPSGFALSASDFAQFIVAAAQRTEVSRPTVLNLDGACSAQLVFPQARLRFGCPGTTFSINRIIVRNEP